MAWLLLCYRYFVWIKFSLSDTDTLTNVRSRMRRQTSHVRQLRRGAKQLFRRALHCRLISRAYNAKRGRYENTIRKIIYWQFHTINFTINFSFTFYVSSAWIWRCNLFARAICNYRIHILLKDDWNVLAFIVSLFFLVIGLSFWICT